MPVACPSVTVPVPFPRPLFCQNVSISLFQPAVVVSGYWPISNDRASRKVTGLALITRAPFAVVQSDIDNDILDLADIDPDGTVIDGPLTIAKSTLFFSSFSRTPSLVLIWTLSQKNASRRLSIGGDQFLFRGIYRNRESLLCCPLGFLLGSV